MKNKIAIASAFLAASSFATAEIVVNDFLSFEGFVDMSYTYLDGDVDGSDETDNNFAIDQVEISWLFDFDPVTAQIDLQFEDLANEGGTRFGDGNTVEQAFATYHFEDGSAITAGRYASMLGFEAFEPTGLYQFSLAYDLQIPGGAAFEPLPANSTDPQPLGETLAGGVGTVEIIPGYAQGVKYTFESEYTFFGISVQDEVFETDGDRLGGDDTGSWGVEAAYSVTTDAGLTWFIGGAWEDGDEDDSYLVNTYATYETGAWIFAAELNYGESDNNSFALGALAPNVDEEEEVLQALLMANYAYSDRASVTGRVSYVDHELGDALELDALKYTLAHGYAFTDNLFLVNEVSYVDGDVDGTVTEGDFDSLLFATELIFSF